MNQQMNPAQYNQYNPSSSSQYVPSQQPQRQPWEEAFHKLEQQVSQQSNQISQLINLVAAREKGTFPSQPLANPKGKTKENAFEVSSSQDNTFPREMKAVTTLRSGKQIDNQVRMPNGSISVVNELLDSAPILDTENWKAKEM
ncbi:hypothetical protein IFM89_015928 [Coptis chinensis]|uniref:Uncharacterized protein n=1 Tax=Coptis chinensis TaxID=261450 RepID=A0A835HVT4_9MAGN|nr:hypothetical protein IFM89_015928 [Coptis chinensis]